MCCDAKLLESKISDHPRIQPKIAMQLLACVWIALCLVADTSARSVTSTEDEIAVVDTPNPLHRNTDGNLSEELCKCENGTCKANDEGKLVCTCPPEWGLYSSSKCAKCDCGKGSNCSFSGSFFVSKTCICKVGYRDMGSYCAKIQPLSTSTSVESSTTTRNSTILPTRHTSSSSSDHSLNFTVDKESTPLFTTLVSTTVVDPCTGNPCQNGGACFVVANRPKCLCKKPYLGNLCEVDPCDWNPCKNGGVCRIEKESFACYCKGPFTGEFCESRMNPCTENLCRNGGTCVIVGDRPKCLCKKPYLGSMCETGPCDWNPCKNGGVCKTENEAVKCYCREPFTGEFCESRTKIDAYVITLVAVSVFLASVLIFVICVLCLK